MADQKSANNDTEELEALFDSIALGASASEVAAPEKVPADGIPMVDQSILHSQIGQMTRVLHNTLRELGYDKGLDEVASAIPDTRERLRYIATMTENAANRTLNAVEVAQPPLAQINDRATVLHGRWEALFAGQLSVEEFRQLAEETRQYLAEVPARGNEVNAQLTEIMMAQDFQDLTGQVVKKITEVAEKLENQLLLLLLETTPAEKRESVDEHLLNGPVINADGRSDIVTSQEQVDELLESLGF